MVLKMELQVNLLTLQESHVHWQVLSILLDPSLQIYAQLLLPEEARFVKPYAGT